MSEIDTSREAIERVGDDDLRMDAYYYGFDQTGIRPVDKILSAVACAGKAFHHTDDWTEECDPAYFAPMTGETPIEWIQNAAIEAATVIRALLDELDRPRAEAAILEPVVPESTEGRADG